MKRRFIFDENYNKKRGKKDKTKILFVGACVLVFIIIAIIVILISKATGKDKDKPKVPNTPVYEVKEELVLESGSYLPEKVDFFTKLENVSMDKIEVIYPSEFEISYDTSMCTPEELEKLTNKEVEEADLACAKQNVMTPHTYGVVLIVEENEYVVNLVIKDSTAPVFIVKDYEMFVGEEYKPENFANICYDINQECKIAFEKEEYANYKEAGEYEIYLVAEDKYGNKTNPTKAKLTIVAPERKLYTVTFKSDGGNEIKPQTVEEGSVVVEPSVSREGYTFLGWYQGNNKFNFETGITSNLTLTAKWKKQNGGGTPDNPDVPSVINVTSVSLNFKKIYLTIGEEKTVVATVRPSNATNRTVTWSSNDKSIATVNNGKIKGIKLGTTTIVATAGGKSATVEVVVREDTGTCKYGDTNYNKNLYTLSVDLTKNNCAVAPGTYNEDLSSRDYSNLVNNVNALGYKIEKYEPTYTRIYNNVGTGMVGYQITIKILAAKDGNTKTVIYVLNSNGSRKFIQNEIGLQ